MYVVSCRYFSSPILDFYIEFILSIFILLYLYWTALWKSICKWRDSVLEIKFNQSIINCMKNCEKHVDNYSLKLICLYHWTYYFSIRKHSSFDLAQRSLQTAVCTVSFLYQHTQPMAWDLDWKKPRELLGLHSFCLQPDLNDTPQDSECQNGNILSHLLSAHT